MNGNQPDIRTVFVAALEKNSPGERAAYLDEACKDNPELRRRVEKLLRAHEQADDFLEADEPEDDDIMEGPGTVIGHYKLLEKIGEGAFGVVFMADQIEPIHRRVALKVVKPGMDTKQVIARFEAERQALAMMDHPNIAHIFDAGTTESGRPYFAMDLVRGVPITEYCDDNKLTWEERLQLFIPVCEAVQHAHHKGIIHRDLKPSNILVTLHDGKPVPIVIDFGTAKALLRPLTDRTMFTAYGRFIGTPQYMSPEQAEMSGLDVDTRADIYSLGVLLYELLTGTTPFEAEELRTVAFEEMLHMIREEDPPKPSTRISSLGERATDIATHRQVNPNELRRSLRGDLDWIVMKTLEKDRARRYATSNELALDIQRHLSDEPVLAGPPGAVYHTRKFIRRHRMGVAFVASIILVLVVGLVVSLIALNEARHQRDKAVTAKEQAALARDDAQTAEDKAEEFRLMARLGSREGRLGYFKNALELHLNAIKGAPKLLWNYEGAHATALFLGEEELTHELCREIISRFGDDPEDWRTCLHIATTILISPDQSYGFDCAVRLVDRALKEDLHDGWSRIVKRTAEYRLGNYEAAAKLMKPLNSAAPYSSKCHVGYVWAMNHWQLGETNAARRVLMETNELCAKFLRAGDLGEGWHLWCYILVLRTESERLILGREVSPPVTAESLAAAYREHEQLAKQHEQLSGLLKDGYSLAQEGKWKESAKVYAALLRHPEFDWATCRSANVKECLGIQMGTVFSRAGDRENYERLCRLLIDIELAGPDDPDVRTARRFARLCFVDGNTLPADLRERGLAMGRLAVAHSEEGLIQAWTSLAGGMAEYFAGDPERAVELLLLTEQQSPHIGCTGGAMVYRAMALKKMGRDAESAELLHEAETVLTEVIRDKYGPYTWWDREIFQTDLEKARIMIEGAAKP